MADRPRGRDCRSLDVRAAGLVSRFRSSPEFVARSDASFGIEGHQQLIESSVALVQKSAFRTRGKNGCGLLNRHTSVLASITIFPYSKPTPRRRTRNCGHRGFTVIDHDVRP